MNAYYKDYTIVVTEIKRSIGGGDYLELEIDVETGQILNWKTTEEQIIAALSK